MNAVLYKLSGLIVCDLAYEGMRLGHERITSGLAMHF
jgi:hypothetical protein